MVRCKTSVKVNSSNENLNAEKSGLTISPIDFSELFDKKRVFATAVLLLDTHQHSRAFYAVDRKTLKNRRSIGIARG